MAIAVRRSQMAGLVTMDTGTASVRYREEVWIGDSGRVEFIPGWQFRCHARQNRCLWWGPDAVLTCCSHSC